jgi:hypothetical protein
MKSIFSFFRGVPTVRPMEAGAGPAILILLFLVNLVYVVIGGTMAGM